MRANGHRFLTGGTLLLLIGAAAPALAGTVTVSPTSATVPLAGQRQLTASVNGSPGAPVAWKVNGMAGGSAAVGSIDASGLYTAPTTGLIGSRFTATATSAADASASASCVITLRNLTPVIAAISPTWLPRGPFTLRVDGTDFAPGALVRWNGAPLSTTRYSSTLLEATGAASQAGSVSITVANPGPDAVSAPIALVVTGPTPSVRPPTPTATPGVPRTPSTSPSPRPESTRTATRTLTASALRTATMTATARVESTRTATRTPTASAVRTATPMRTEPSRTIGATATASVRRTASVSPTAGAKIAVRVSPASATVQTAATLQLQATVTGTTNQGVTWMVNGSAGGDASVGTITGAGLYGAPAAVPSTGSVTVSAVSVADGSARGSALLTIQDPMAVTYGRFLDQATFGPTQALTAHLAQIGIPAFIEEQFAMPESPWPALDTAQRSDAVDAFFANAMSGEDQLRQRIVFALSEIIVEAMNKNTNGDEIVPWLELLSRNAFGNYRTLLEEITLDASMGLYLDLANSGLSGGAPNENFPREVMQLFSIGLYQLNPDGSVQVDAHNVPIPTYTQTDVQQLAKALTGWTYGNAGGAPPSYGNFSYYPGPMLPVAAYHDKSAKTILGHALPANQGIQQDLDGAIDILFQHPNVGPFLATRLIRALVTSNPTPAYIGRVAAAFNGTGVRGDMRAVIRAILLDPEARNDTPPATFGRLRSPMQHTIALARALGLDLGPASQFAYLFYNMNEGLLDAASVFGHYSPTYHIPLSALYGPEFQIYSASDAINRANLFYSFLYNPWPINPALQPFVAVAGDAAALVNAVDAALLFGRMSQATRTALLTAIAAMPDDNARVLTAVYLTSMSGEYLIQR